MTTTVKRLSPLNLRGLLATLGMAEPDARPMGALHRRRPIECWRCPECLDVHDDEDDAAECCKPTPAEADASSRKCPVCGTAHDSHEAAADCCLWKDFDAPTRWRMAAAVEAGSTWSEQLGLDAGGRA